jgi:glycosyltransferase involved in cell wall biosynthesis
MPFAAIPQGELPRIVNPPAGFVVTANNDPLGITLDNDPLNQRRRGGGILYLSARFNIGIRAQRVTELLRERTAAGCLTLEDNEEIQADVVLVDARFFTPFIVRAFENAGAAGAPPELAGCAADRGLAEAVGRLRRWDFSTPTGVREGFDAAAEEDRPFDVIHDHVGHTALAMADRVGTPLVHTLHGPFDEAACRFYAQHGPKACIVGISRAQLDSGPEEMGGGRVVHNPIETGEWPFSADKRDYVLWIGRMSPDKGPHRAIAAAREAGVRVVLAGPVQPGQEQYFADAVEPCIGDGCEYVGEADADRKRELYLGARALLMPIRWPEPFGLVMVESLACGTPVIAFREGSVPEVVKHGETGFVVDDEHEMAAAIARAGELDPAVCRRDCEERFGVDAVVRGYEQVYRSAMAQPVPA